MWAEGRASNIKTLWTNILFFPLSQMSTVYQYGCIWEEQELSGGQQKRNLAWRSIMFALNQAHWGSVIKVGFFLIINS